MGLLAATRQYNKSALSLVLPSKNTLLKCVFIARVFKSDVVKLDWVITFLNAKIALLLASNLKLYIFNIKKI